MKTSILKLLMFASIKFIHVFIIQLIAMQLLLANSSQSQQLEEVSLPFKIKDAGLEQVFASLEQQTNFKFGYNRQVIDKSVQISFNGEQRSLYNILLSIAEKADLKFKRINQQILVLKDDYRGDNSNKIQVIQAKTISGKVTDADNNEGLAGVNVVVPDSGLGTITNANGTYTLEVPESANVLTFSFMGYESKQVTIGNRSVIDVALDFDLTSLQEVVVTALGIERETKNLSYAIQKVEGQDLDQARETNFVNSLAGKVAGVQVTNSSNGIAGSSRITIRGESSLNLGNNSPLFVVDGVPITNQNPQYGGGSVDFGGGDIPHDFGNAAAEINPDDIASVTVLKGPNAAALYGARAANGVILITTKSGKQSRGLGIAVNSAVTFDDYLRLPDYQNVYGGGLNPDAYDLYDTPPTRPSEAANSGGYSYGPRMEGQLFKQFGSPVLANGDREPIPYVPHPDNVGNFFETGITSNHNLAFTYGAEDANVRLSYTRLDQTGIVPNTDLNRNYLSFNAGAQLHEKLRIDAVANYVNSSSDNVPTSGYGPASYMYNFIWQERNFDLDWFRDYWVDGLEGIQQRNNLTFSDNVFFMANETLSPFDKNRIFGNLRASLDITDNLMLQLRTGLDSYSEVRKTRKAFSSLRRPQGMYRFQQINFVETNSDLLLRYQKNLSKDFSLDASLGGNIMRQNNRIATATNVSLAIPEVYNIGNTGDPTQLDELDLEKAIHSVYALAQVGYKNYLFLDLTARNDWSSTLPVNDNSYFYPSVGISGVISEMIDLSPASISFFKLRTSWAQVGNDTDPFQLQQFYSYSESWGNNAAVTNRSIIANTDLKPELTSTWEVGGAIGFMNNRLNLDFTYYNITSENQILPVPLSNTTGFGSRLLNAGEIVNKGVELMLDAQILKTNSGFNWGVNVNFTRNRSEVVELAPGVDSYIMGVGPGTTVWGSVEARPGQRMGDMYGFGYQRDPQGNIIWSSNDATARPLQTPTTNAYGNYNPDWMAGITNTFRYKGFELSLLFDHRQGGEVHSFTHANGSISGSLDHTLPGRETGIVPRGVYETAEGTFAPLSINLPARDYYIRRYNRGILEANIFDATFTKLREVKFGYNFPNSFSNKIGIRDLRLYLVGRNLFLWTDVPHIDPETMALNSGTFSPGFEVVQLPSTRSFGVNLSFKL